MSDNLQIPSPADMQSFKKVIFYLGIGFVFNEFNFEQSRLFTVAGTHTRRDVCLFILMI